MLNFSIKFFFLFPPSSYEKISMCLSHTNGCGSGVSKQPFLAFSIRVNARVRRSKLRIYSRSWYLPKHFVLSLEMLFLETNSAILIKFSVGIYIGFCQRQKLSNLVDISSKFFKYLKRK